MRVIYLHQNNRNTKPILWKVSNTKSDTFRGGHCKDAAAMLNCRKCVRHTRRSAARRLSQLMWDCCLFE